MYVCVFDVLVFNSIQLNFNFLFRLKICMYVCIYWINIYINIFLLIIHSHSINIQSYRSFFSSLSLSLSIYICLWMVFFFIHPLYIVDRGFTAHCFIFQSIYMCVCACMCIFKWVNKNNCEEEEEGKNLRNKERKEKKKFCFF